MINLIIHEFRRSLSGKIVCLGLILMPEIMLLIGINGVKRSEFGGPSTFEGALLGIGMTFLTLAIVGVYLYLCVEAILLLNKDLKSTKGYMLFMTPNSRYKLLGAKMIMSLISVLVFMSLSVFLIWLDISSVGEFSDDIFNELSYRYSRLFGDIPIWKFIVYYMGSWLLLLSIGGFAVILSKYIKIANTAARTLVSFIIFFVMNYVLQYIISKIVAAVTGDMSGTFDSNTLIFGGDTDVFITTASMASALVGTAIVSVLIAAILFVLNGWLLDRKVTM